MPSPKQFDFRLLRVGSFKIMVSRNRNQIGLISKITENSPEVFEKYFQSFKLILITTIDKVATEKDKIPSTSPVMQLAQICIELISHRSPMRATAALFKVKIR